MGITFLQSPSDNEIKFDGYYRPSIYEIYNDSVQEHLNEDHVYWKMDTNGNYEQIDHRVLSQSQDAISIEYIGIYPGTQPTHLANTRCIRMCLNSEMYRTEISDIMTCYRETETASDEWANTAELQDLYGDGNPSRNFEILVELLYTSIFPAER